MIEIQFKDQIVSREIDAKTTFMDLATVAGEFWALNSDYIFFTSTPDEHLPNVYLPYQLVYTQACVWDNLNLSNKLFRVHTVSYTHLTLPTNREV